MTVKEDVACECRNKSGRSFVPDPKPHDQDSIRLRNHRHNQRWLRSSPVSNANRAPRHARRHGSGLRSLPFKLDDDSPRGIIEKIGVGKIVRRDKRTYFRSNSGLQTADPRSPGGRNYDGISLNCKGGIWRAWDAPNPHNRPDIESAPSVRGGDAAIVRHDTEWR